MKAILATITLLGLLFTQIPTQAQFTQTWNGQVFILDTSSPRMSYPWEIIYGPDDSLWITEAHDYLITKMHPGNYGKRTLLNLSGQRNFPNGAAQWPQGGLMGMALHPDLLNGKPYVYVAFVYFKYGNSGSPNNSLCSGATGNHPCFYKTKIVRYTYNLVNKSLGSPVTVLDGLSGSNDHNSGRMKIGPDLKLYYTIGDQGAGQFNNLNRTNNAQDPDIYEGKILRLNTEPDGDAADAADPYNEWIPNDNPFTNSVTGYTLATYSYGHRNAQGLAWGNVAGVDILYSSEHGDKSDDEVNIIEAGTNYGWPKVAGKCDNNYNTFDGFTSNDQLAGQNIGREDTFCTNHNVREPIFQLMGATPTQINGENTGNIYTWYTVAPSSIEFYDGNYIPGWHNSLLVTSLKYGLFRLKLNSSGTGIDPNSTPQPIDTIAYFHGFRIRDVAIAPTGDTLFFVIDSTGNTSGPTGGFNGSGNSNVTDAGGKILRAIFATQLDLKDYIPNKPINNRTYVSVYPNPTSQMLYVESMHGMHKPLRVELYDDLGRMILNQTTPKDNFSINIGSFMNGVYIFKLYNGDETLITTEKIVKQ
jgi:PQQ-dependent dehydrogenase (s-GDH family)